MNAIVPYVFPVTGQSVRSVTFDGEPWFVGKDVALNLSHTNPRKAVRDHVPAGHKGGNERFPLAELGLDPQTVLIDEPGMYRLILRSNTELAEPFQEWVTSEVLPAIRKTGSYNPPPALPDITTAEGQHAVAQLLVASTAQNLVLSARVQELEPEAARAARTLDADGLALVGTVAKRFGIKERPLFAFLRAEKLLIDGGNKHNEPYAEFIRSGHFDVKVRLVGADPDRPMQERSTPMVTPKGEALIWKRLYAAGMVASPRMPAPVSEQLQIGA